MPKDYSDLVTGAWRNIRRMGPQDLRDLRKLITDVLGDEPQAAGTREPRKPRNPRKPSSVKLKQETIEEPIEEPTEEFLSTVAGTAKTKPIGGELGEAFKAGEAEKKAKESE